MRIVEMYSHLNGYEWILVHQKKVWKELEAVIESIDAAVLRTKISKEKTMKGKALFSPKELNKEFDRQFTAKGWQESRTNYWVTAVPHHFRTESGPPILAPKETLDGLTEL